MLKRLSIAARGIIFFAALLASCSPQGGAILTRDSGIQAPAQQEQPEPTRLPTRRQFEPGEQVDYLAQTGDTLPALAAHFNTTIKEIRQANPVIPQDVTTLPPGLPLKIPIYYQSLWGSEFQIIPDSLFIYGLAQVGFDAAEYVRASSGWFRTYTAYAGGMQRTGGELVEHIAINYSISPRLLLAILEYQTGALTRITSPDPQNPYPLGLQQREYQGLYAQLVFAANLLNNAYYGWRTGELKSLETIDGRIEIPDPWQNAATVALHVYFASIYTQDEYETAIHAAGLQQTYTELFDDPWSGETPHIPGSLQQPDFLFPFQIGASWAYTGGPHTGWGNGLPLAAIDFAPPSVVGGCEPSFEWVTAVADGVIVRTDIGIAVLDLDGDENEQTGWVIFYLHLASENKAAVGSIMKAGDPVGHPSCEGGRATGTHIHIARKYNGEWISADGALAFNLEGWNARNGNAPYEGTLERFGKIVYACTCSDITSQVQSLGPKQ